MLHGMIDFGEASRLINQDEEDDTLEEDSDLLDEDEDALDDETKGDDGDSDEA